MESTNNFILASSLWLAIQSLPLLLTPSLTITLLSPKLHEPTSLEIHGSRFLAFALLLSAISLTFALGPPSTTNSPLNPGTAPLTTSTAAPPTSPSDSTPDDELQTIAKTTTILATFYHVTITIYTYVLYTHSATSNTAFLLGTIISGGLSVFGGWTVMFGGGSHFSKRTGVDKRVGGWPFGNGLNEKKRESARSKPKRF